MNKIEKYLRKLADRQQLALLLAMDQIRADYRMIPNLRALSGKKGWFRVRVGHYRIVFEVTSDKRILFHHLGSRDDRTYKNL